MRLVYTLNDQRKGYELSSFLTAEGIENQLEISKNTDWGSPDYGDVTCRLWIIDEELVETALRWIDLFQTDPTNPIFKKTYPQKTEKKTEDIAPLKSIKPAQISQPDSPKPIGTITLYLLLLCCILFFATEMTTPAFTPFPPTLPATPLFSAPIKKKLLYDYPYAYEIVDKLVNLFGIEKLQTPDELPAEGKYLLEKYYKTPYWHGFYETLLHHFHSSNATAKEIDPNTDAPLFEKIRIGEFWRLFTPCLLHSDILHIAFNMIWLIVLGKQLETRLGAWRYLLFIVITGIFSNTAQYLMGGPNFIGFSGVLCAMLAFIWVRQRKAAWEGYQLEGSTLKFMAFFILAMFALQLVSFYFEASMETSISPGVANTAHLAGALSGYLLGQLSKFAWKT